MEYETISRLLYLQLIEDGVRVDRVRVALQKAENEIHTATAKPE